MSFEVYATCFLFTCGCGTVTIAPDSCFTCHLHKASVCRIEWFEEKEGPFDSDFLDQWLEGKFPYLEKQLRRFSLPANIVNQVRSTKYLYEDSRPDDHPQEGQIPQDSCPSDFAES